MEKIIITILAAFFAINMGGATFAASFAAAYGGRIVDRYKAAALFFVFVVLGAVSFGDQVTLTLGQAIIPETFLNLKTLCVIFVTAGLSMFLANMIHIPQSTSLVTVAAISGVGAFYGHVFWPVIWSMLPYWILLPVLSYFITWFCAGLVYPPRPSNYWIYEKFINHQSKLKKFVLLCACYNAFSVGTNNVANVVGPLYGAGWISMFYGLLIFAAIYSCGAMFFMGPLKTAGNKVVPLGLTTAAIISIVSGTLMIFASFFGIPQSFVMLQLGAIFAVSSLKHSHEATFTNKVTQKTLYTWTVNPLITFVLSYACCYAVESFFK